MIETFLEELLNNSRFLHVLFDNLPLEIKKSKLYNFTTSYLEKYVRFNNISSEDAVTYYTKFVTAFNKDCKEFIRSGKYPFELGKNDFSIGRQEYDIVLLLSVLFTPHRFRIMKLLEKKISADKALFIGLGPGLELALTKENYKLIKAYDLSVNEFLISEFSDISFNMELYTGQDIDYFDAIYLIEILEHLTDPISLLEISHRSLKKGGSIFLTTATDLPQFDHLYNFPLDHSLFEKQIKELGFTILYKEMIPHNYLTLAIKPCNHFYTLIKN